MNRILTLLAFLFVMSNAALAQHDNPAAGASTAPARPEYNGEHGGQIVKSGDYTLELIRKKDLLMIAVTSDKAEVSEKSIGQIKFAYQGKDNSIYNIPFQSGFFRFNVGKNFINSAVMFEGFINGKTVTAGWEELN